MLITGKTELHCETGTEGQIWSVYEDNKEGWDGFWPVENGDHLTVLRDGIAVFADVIDLDYTSGEKARYGMSGYDKQIARGLWINGVQKGWGNTEWFELFQQELDAKLKPKRSFLSSPLPNIPTASQLNKMEGNPVVIANHRGEELQIQLLDASVKFGIDNDAIVYNAIAYGELIKVVARLRDGVSNHNIMSVFLEFNV